MPVTCAIFTCKASNVKHGKRLSYFHFPKDEDLRNKWYLTCGRPYSNSINLHHARVCELHFTPDDFVRNLQAELLGTSAKAQLKADAIPKVNICITRDTMMGCDLLPCQQSNMNTDNVSIAALLVENEALRKRLQEKNRQVKSLQSQVRIYKFRATNRSQKHIKYQNAMEMLFSKTQIDLLLEKKKKVRWSEKDLTQAFTLSCLSQHAYSYLKNDLHFPLPARSTLRRWASKNELKQEILDSVLKLMEISGSADSEV